MIRILLIVFFLAGCSPIPVQVQSSKQEQTQQQSNEQQQSANQQSDHQSEARQGTNSMPVIIICNTVSSPNGHCIAPNEDSPLKKHINNNFKGAPK